MKTAKYLVLLGFAGWLLSVACSTGDGAPPDDLAVAKAEKHVTLRVDFGDGFEKAYTQLVWIEGMTVGDAMKQASRHRRPTTFEVRGRAANSLLRQIDDSANEGGGGRNWIYRVNDRKGETSFAVFRLAPNDVILWKFETYQ